MPATDHLPMPVSSFIQIITNFLYGNSKKLLCGQDQHNPASASSSPSHFSQACLI
jgi:hypothetical protein